MAKLLCCALLAVALAALANGFRISEQDNEITGLLTDGVPENEEAPDEEFVNDFECLGDGLHPNPRNCSTFVQCSNGTPHMMSCPTGLHYSADTKRCEPQCDAYCNRTLSCECKWPTCATGICALTKEAGPCRAGLERYFYNSRTRLCEKFLYGGCMGNDNNFQTKTACETSCIFDWQGVSNMIRLSDFDECVRDLLNNRKMQNASFIKLDFFSKVCIEDLGCFYTGPPFFHPVHRPVSLSPTKNVDKIHFRLFTRHNSEYRLEPDSKSIRESHFNPDLETKCIIHGYTVKFVPGHVMYRMKEAILANGDYNVIIVDWTQINDLPYAQAAANTRVVGAKLAKLIQALMNETSVSAESFHIIGHSLGAHTAGYAGERIQNLGRITGLDPAGPYFRHSGPEVSLDPTDAQFVDIIHTDGSDLVVNGYGIGPPLGHMDFYPNGGTRQPGCWRTFDRGDLFDRVVDNNDTTTRAHLTELTSCDHARAVDYFVESVDNSACKFLAVSCDSYSHFEEGLCPPGDLHSVVEIGFHAKMATGIDFPARYYMRTRMTSPYCDEDTIHTHSR